MFDSVRYYLALLMLVAFTPAILAWLLVHPLIRMWRRAGTRVTYTVVILFSNSAELLLYLVRHRVLVGDRGGSLPLGLTGLALIVLSGVLRRRLGRQLSPRTLMGLPEVAPDRMPQPLLTSGIYARIRHPRYVQFSLGALGLALIIDYRGFYALYLAWLAAIYLVVILEEKELRARYGPAYDEYARQVPRFLPRRHSRA